MYVLGARRHVRSGLHLPWCGMRVVALRLLFGVVRWGWTRTSAEGFLCCRLLVRPLWVLFTLLLLPISSPISITPRLLTTFFTPGSLLLLRSPGTGRRYSCWRVVLTGCPLSRAAPTSSTGSRRARVLRQFGARGYFVLYNPHWAMGRRACGCRRGAAFRVQADSAAGGSRHRFRGCCPHIITVLRQVACAGDHEAVGTQAEYATELSWPGPRRASLSSALAR